MQSFGDDTLLACIDIEKRHQTLQKQTGGKIQELQEENVSDLDKYFKSNSLLSEFANTQNNVDKSRSSDSDTKRIEKKKMYPVKYLEDSILIPKTNSRRNLSPAFSAPKGNSLPSQKKRSPHKTNNENVDTNLKEKHRSGITNSTKKCEKFSTQGLYKNKSSNDTQNATSSSDVLRLSAVNSAYDEENSEFVISSPPIGTQDRCKLVSWSLPPNILQVLHYNKFNKYLYVHKVYYKMYILYFVFS